MISAELKAQLEQATSYGVFTNLALENGLHVRESALHLLAYEWKHLNEGIKSKPFCQRCGTACGVDGIIGVSIDGQWLCEPCNEKYLEEWRAKYQ